MTIADLYPIHDRDMELQHSDMHSMLGKIAASIRSSKVEAIQDQLHSFIRYTKMHFADEEQFMRGCTYPGRWEHEQEHSRLVQQLEDIQEAVAKRSPHVADFNDLMSLWFDRHTTGSDQAYRQFCEENPDRIITMVCSGVRLPDL